MDRMYFKLAEKAIEVAGLANALAMNANYREDVDAATRPELRTLHKALSDAQQMLFRSVCRQMGNDPQEREIDIKVG